MKPTKFEMYTQAIHEYMDLFGLKDWEYVITEDRISDRAQVHYNMDDRIASFIYNRDPEEHCNPRKSAFHEVMELFLANIGQFSFNGNISEEERTRRNDEETHRVIRTLENVVFPELEKVF